MQIGNLSESTTTLFQKKRKIIPLNTISLTTKSGKTENEVNRAHVLSRAWLSPRNQGILKGPRNNRLHI